MRAAIEGHTSLVRIIGQMSCQIDNDVVVMQLNTGKYFSLDAGGTRIWSLLETSHTLDQLVSTLLDEFEVPAEECRRDTLAFLEHLRSWGLIEVPA